MSNRTIWTLDVNGALELNSDPEEVKYEVYMQPPDDIRRYVLRTNSKSELRIWMNLNNLVFDGKPSLMSTYHSKRIRYAHFMLEEARDEANHNKDVE
jgi:hypothetical protein